MLGRSATWERGVKWAKRRPAAATLAITSILAVVTLLTISISFNFRLQEAADAKENEAQGAREEREKADIARAMPSIRPRSPAKRPRKQATGNFKPNEREASQGSQ